MALSRSLRIVAVVVLVAGIGLTACGDDEGTVTSTTVSPSATTGGVTTTAPTSETTTTTTIAGRVAEFVYFGGKVESGESRVTVKLGEQVTIRVVSDVAEEVHVHTYDLTLELEPAVPGRLTFTADIPGVHEVELEQSHIHLTSLEVQ